MAFDVSDLVKCLSGNLPYAIVGEIDDFELFVVVPQSEDVPIQLGNVIPVENQDLSVVWQQFQNVRI